MRCGVAMIPRHLGLVAVLVLSAVPTCDTFAFLETMPLDVLPQGWPAHTVGVGRERVCRRDAPVARALLTLALLLILRWREEAKIVFAILARENVPAGVRRSLNFRDLGNASSATHGMLGRVFRTACLQGDREAAVADAAQKEHQVRVILDLRSDDEMKDDRPFAGTDHVFSRDRQNLGVERAAKAWEEGAGAHRYIVPLLTREHLVPGVRRWMGPLDELAMLWSIWEHLVPGVRRRMGPLEGLAMQFWAIFDPEREQTAFIREINDGGLPLLNILMLECARPELSWALQLLITLLDTAVPAGRGGAGGGIAIQCRLGKDRTGLVSALLLLAAGATHEEVIADYARSDGMDEIALGGIKSYGVDAIAGRDQG
ncbi:hypothetical protein T484DRAFT_1763145 [Baffinella frigidus]|nr:hypothetical protein T484DRAFT_1763145 [Cryptophyta sp. CCMP2293]